MSRPSIEEINTAREWFTADQFRIMETEDKYKRSVDMIRVLLAATEPPTDEEIADAYVENICPRASERLADTRSERVRDVILTIREPAAPWPDEVYAARTVRHFLGPVKP